jgi:hypothetical protein
MGMRRLIAITRIWVAMYNCTGAVYVPEFFNPEIAHSISSTFRWEIA